MGDVTTSVQLMLALLAFR